MFYYLPFTFLISVTCASSDRISSENIPRKFEILFSSVIIIYTQTSFPFSSLAFSFLRLYESRKTNDDWRNWTKANSKSYSITIVYTTNTNNIIRTFLPLEGGKLQRTKNHFILKPHPQKTIETKTSRANISLHLSLSLKHQLFNPRPLSTILESWTVSSRSRSSSSQNSQRLAKNPAIHLSANLRNYTSQTGVSRQPFAAACTNAR